MHVIERLYPATVGVYVHTHRRAFSPDLRAYARVAFLNGASLDRRASVFAKFHVARVRARASSSKRPKLSPAIGAATAVAE